MLGGFSAQCRTPFGSVSICGAHGVSHRNGRNEYIRRYVPEYPVVRFINERVDENAKVFCLFIGDWGHYLDRDALFDNGQFREMARRAVKPGEILAAFKARGVTHLLVRFDIHGR